jgi:hypothetical protein
MYGYHRNGLLYLSIAKNASTTYSSLLESHGWDKIDLVHDKIDLDQVKIWGHIADPETRHTKGLCTYLMMNRDIDFKSPAIGKILVSGVFDEHTYSLHMLLAHYLHRPIHWIPIDQEFIEWNRHPSVRRTLNGDDLTNMFFADHGVDIVVTPSDRKNQTAREQEFTRNQITHWKTVYNTNYQKLMANFLDADIALYTKVVDSFRNKFANTTGVYLDN